MKTFSVSALALLALLIGVPAFAADTTYLTGDATLDVALTDADAAGAADASFLQKVADQYKVPLADLQALKSAGLKPGEIILAVNISQSTKKPLTEVTATWKSTKGKGWGEIAKSLGVKPGSDAFKTLKKEAIDQKDRLKKGDDTMMKAAETNKDANAMKKGDDKKPEDQKKPEAGKKP